MSSRRSICMLKTQYSYKSLQVNGTLAIHITGSFRLRGIRGYHCRLKLLRGQKRAKIGGGYVC